MSELKNDDVVSGTLLTGEHIIDDLAGIMSLPSVTPRE